MPPWVNDSPIAAFNRHDVNCAASDRFIDEHTPILIWFGKADTLLRYWMIPRLDLLRPTPSRNSAEPSLVF
jgi:hypothetical protein